MGFSIGIVGLPNVGKSTLFKALTKKSVLIANYPFATIDPNVGIVEVPDFRLQELARVSQSAKIIPTTIEFYDIAGLVRGASQGEGLGNQFLSHIREVDAIVEVVRAFENDDIVHVSGKIDPTDDVETINLELIYADLSVVSKRLEGLKKSMKAGETHEQKLALSAFEKVNVLLSAGRPAREAALTEDEVKPIKDVHLLTAKPLLYVVNVNETQLRSDFRISSLPSELQIPLCVK